ncbi:hypothetical protein PMAYCL1PPCAC_30633, partial [Pristionchus mayeri]
HTKSEFQYVSRGIRSLEARTCPYCDEQFASCHMVEHHTRRMHMAQRTEVYGCSECGRWCCTVMALIKHWDKHACPSGRLVIRKPNDTAVPRIRKRDETKVS